MPPGAPGPGSRRTEGGGPRPRTTRCTPAARSSRTGWRTRCPRWRSWAPARRAPAGAGGGTGPSPPPPLAPATSAPAPPPRSHQRALLRRSRAGHGGAGATQAGRELSARRLAPWAR